MQDGFPKYQSTSERTHLDPMSREDTTRSWSVVRRGYTSILCQERTRLDPMSDEWTRLHPGQERVHLNPTLSGEDSEHQETIEYTFTLHIRRGHTSILCRHGRERLIPNGSSEMNGNSWETKGRVEMSTNKRCYDSVVE